MESTKFGDHIAGDHLVTRDVNKELVDFDGVAMVVKDVATNFQGIALSARSHAKNIAFWFLGILLHLVMNSECFTSTVLRQSSLPVAK